MPTAGEERETKILMYRKYSATNNILLTTVAIGASACLLWPFATPAWAVSGPGAPLSQVQAAAAGAIPQTESFRKYPSSTEADHAVQEQTDSPASVCNTAAYMEDSSLVSKTFLFPGQSTYNSKDPQDSVLAFRRYIFSNRLDQDKQDVRCYRHYEFFRHTKSDSVSYPYEVPVISGEGFTRFEKEAGCVFTDDHFVDGDNIVCCEVPPSTQAGKIFEFKGLFYRTAHNLYTITTPAGVFKNCQMVCVYGKTKELAQGSSVSFYAPKLGEVLAFSYNPETKDFYPRNILASYEVTNRPSLDKTPLEPQIGAYLPAPNLASKSLSVPVPTELKKANITDCFKFYDYEHQPPFDYIKVNWLRRDAASDPKNPAELISPNKDGIQGVDFIDAESQSYMRLYKTAQGNSLVLLIPPLAYLDEPYLFDNRWYKVESNLYNIHTEVGDYANCLRITYYGTEKDKLKEGSFRAYYAPNFGEIGREQYNPKSDSFELDSQLYQYKVGAAHK